VIARADRKKVISVSSLYSENGTSASLDDFASIARIDAGSYHAMTSYRESKLAQVLFTVALADRYGADGFRSAAVHPGVVNTNLFYRNGLAFLRQLAKRHAASSTFSPDRPPA
jgi:NAD(P)-dependent dehydrogenase (short-subunit alcohol dehydrogenase family)